MSADRAEIAVQILKTAGDITFCEAIVTVANTIVARGKLGFARRTLAIAGS